MSITPKAIQDLLEELEASKQSRLRAWNALQRIRALLSDLGKTEIRHRPTRHSMPRAKSWDTLSRDPCTSGTRRSKVCVHRCAVSGTPLSRKNAKAIIRRLFRRCGKRWIGREEFDSGLIPHLRPAWRRKIQYLGDSETTVLLTQKLLRLNRFRWIKPKASG
jgi:hypothetical protein